MMNKIKKLFFLLMLPLILLLTACINKGYVKIEYEGSLEINVGTSIQLVYETSDNLKDEKAEWNSSSSCIIIDDEGLMFAQDIGSSKISVTIKGYTNSLIFNVVSSGDFTLNASKYEIVVGEEVSLYCTNISTSNVKPTYEIISGSEFGEIENNILRGLKKGSVSIIAKIENKESNVLTINVINKKIETIELSASDYYLYPGNTSTLFSTFHLNDAENNIVFEVIVGTEYININNNIITCIKGGGESKIIAKSGDILSNEITIYSLEEVIVPDYIEISVDKDKCDVGDYLVVNYKVFPTNASKKIEFVFKYGEDKCNVIENKLYITSEGAICFYIQIEGVKSNEIVINQTITEYDPYEGVSKQEFYANYKEAIDYKDAYYRSEHGFMSGSIDDQDQAPTIASNRPKENNQYLKNSYMRYSDDGNTYYILDSNGSVVDKVYKNGAYVTLEEVAAYIFAFGDVPANYTTKKSGNPSNSIWGEYLRVNHSYFSGDTSRYPYEPILPNINGCGGELNYYELDIGTTGTDCDPKYEAYVYNDGYEITRGAARIVYARYDKYEEEITDINSKYLFYTYNHYNDFQEYLNYQGGWGEMFGNITGGGTISSKYDYNPTDYVDVKLYDFRDLEMVMNFVPLLFIRKKESIFCF